MGKAIPDARIDAALDAETSTTIHVCSAEPANYAGIAAVMLAEQAIVGVQAKANGDLSGRKITTPLQSAVPVTNTGLGDHIVQSNGVNEMFRVTTAAVPVALTALGTVDINAHKLEIADPV